MYTSEVSWQQELWRLLPTILLIGGYVWFTRWVGTQIQIRWFRLQNLLP